MKKNFAIVLFVVALGTFGCTSADCPNGYCKENVYHPPVVTDNGPTMPDVKCWLNEQCDDDDPETSDVCSDGKCFNNPRPPCDYGWTRDPIDGECKKLEASCTKAKPVTDLCTTKYTCDIDTGEWNPTVVDCDDDNPLTDDSCEPTSGCNHEFNCGGPGMCLDDDPCTVNWCDPAARKCQKKALCRDNEVCVSGICQFRCSEHSDCDDWNPCTQNFCDTASGVCSFPQFTCDDGDDSTFDACQVVGGKKNCVNVVTDCNGNGNDGNPCTDDVCKNAEWKHIAKQCGEGLFCSPETGKCEIVPVLACTTEHDPKCNDHDPCTDDVCVMKNGEPFCKHTDVECGEGQACNADDGECVDMESPDCVDDPQGSTCDDENSATLDYCLMGECQHTQPVSCGEGTFLNPQSGECEPAVSDSDCQDGARKCQQFELTKTMVYSVCAEGHWFLVEDCGKIGAMKCSDTDGCRPIGS